MQASQQKHASSEAKTGPVVRDPFGSAVAAAPAFGGTPAKAAGSVQAAQSNGSPAENSPAAGKGADGSLVMGIGAHSSAGESDAQPGGGPFGSQRGVLQHHVYL